MNSQPERAPQGTGGTLEPVGPSLIVKTEAAGYIAAWQPSSVPPQAAAFARQVVAQAAPPGRERAKNLLWAAGRLAGWAIGLGLEPVPQVLVHPSVIERFTAHAPGLTGVTRRTLRTNLRFLARAAVPHLVPADAPLPRERAKAPYTAAEIAGFLALAAAQPALARRMRAAALVCLGAGKQYTHARDRWIVRPATGAVHALLDFLGSRLEHTPRVVGFDEQGREVLTFPARAGRRY
jgi:hypothetical protein